MPIHLSHRQRHPHPITVMPTTMTAMVICIQQQEQQRQQRPRQTTTTTTTTRTTTATTTATVTTTFHSSKPWLSSTTRVLQKRLRSVAGRWRAETLLPPPRCKHGLRASVLQSDPRVQRSSSESVVPRAVLLPTTRPPRCWKRSTIGLLQRDPLSTPTVTALGAARRTVSCACSLPSCACFCRAGGDVWKECAAWYAHVCACIRAGQRARAPLCEGGQGVNALSLLCAMFCSVLTNKSLKLRLALCCACATFVVQVELPSAAAES
jgi:hypothetical protein